MPTRQIDLPDGTNARAGTIDSAPIDETSTSAGNTKPWRSYTLAGCLYLLVSLFVWSNVWRSHPTSATTCGCGDPSMFTWYLAWPAFAIRHGLNPFYSTHMGFPQGTNLLANTSDVAIGVVLAPVTWLFGPIASLNVALTLSPVLSAFAMFLLLRRWVSWAPAAFVGGLFYGFSPFVLVSLSSAWLDLGMLAIPPLVIICLDELLFTQRRRPMAVGVVLGLLLTIQFFIGSEVLLITVMMSAIGVGLVVAYAAVHDPATLRNRFRFAASGIGAAVVVTFVLLFLPVQFAITGPAHLSSPVWGGGVFGSFRDLKTSLRDFAFPWSASDESFLATIRHQIGGYQGPDVSYQYFGLGMVLVLGLGLIAWRRDRRLWFFGTMTVCSIVLTLGSSHVVLLPWQVVANLPIFDDLEPYRFVFVTYLAAAVMLAVIMQHSYCWINRNGAVDKAPTPGRSTRVRTWAPWSGAAVALIVACIALVPPAADLAKTIPITIEPVAIPPWFRTVAPHLSASQVVLIFPSTFGSSDTASTWQAETGLNYSMVNLSGPGALAPRLGHDAVAATVIGNASEPIPTKSAVSTQTIIALRNALRDWKVTMVVIPDQPSSLPVYYKVPSETYAAALMTAATGQAPTYQAHAWVWSDIRRRVPTTPPTGDRFSTCTDGRPTRGTTVVNDEASCLLAPSVGQ